MAMSCESHRASYADPRRYKLWRAQTRLKSAVFNQALGLCGKLTNPLVLGRAGGHIVQATKSHDAGAKDCKSDGVEQVRGDVIAPLHLAAPSREDV